MNITNTNTYNTKNITFPTGFELIWTGSVLPQRTLREHGTVLNRSDYPTLFTYAVSSGSIVSEEQWQDEKLYGLFSYGDNKTTFRIPDKRELSPVGYNPDYHSKLGMYVPDQIQHYTATFYFQDNNGGLANLTVGGGAARLTAPALARSNRGGCSGAVPGFIVIDPSISVRTGDRVQTRGFTCDWIIFY